MSWNDRKTDRMHTTVPVVSLPGNPDNPDRPHSLTADLSAYVTVDRATLEVVERSVGSIVVNVRNASKEGDSGSTLSLPLYLAGELIAAVDKARDRAAEINHAPGGKVPGL